MTTKCTCRSTPRERFLDRQCPIHGDAETRRRHEAARRASRPVEELSDAELEQEFAALFDRLDPATQQVVRNVMEDCCHE